MSSLRSFSRLRFILSASHCLRCWANKLGRIINHRVAHGLVASPYKSAYVAASTALSVDQSGAETGGASIHLQCHLSPATSIRPLGRDADRWPSPAHGNSARTSHPRRPCWYTANKRFATVEELVGALAVVLASEAAHRVHRRWPCPVDAADRTLESVCVRC